MFCLPSTGGCQIQYLFTGPQNMSREAAMANRPIWTVQLTTHTETESYHNAQAYLKLIYNNKQSNGYALKKTEWSFHYQGKGLKRLTVHNHRNTTQNGVF